MKKSKGFLLLQELLYLCCCCLLLAAAARAYSSCLRLQEENLALQAGLQAAQQVLAGQEYTGELQLTRTVTDFNGLQLVEVQVTDGRMHCNLLQALP